MSGLVHAQIDRVKAALRRLAPGLLLASLVAMSAQFVAEHSQAPAMMMALLFGVAVSFLEESDASVRPGIEFAAKSVLKIGIILLGARMSVEVFTSFGWQTLLIILVALLSTIAFGVAVARLLGLTRSFAILTAGAVSICGASAALAISAVLPKTKDTEKQLFVTIIGVTALSTVAMILYPALLAKMDASDTQAGRIIGATIHDVAQVVGAGFSISPVAGDTATLVKLVRVSLLAPTIIVLALLMRQQISKSDQHTKRPPLVPAFVLGFFALAVLNNFGFIPAQWQPTISMIAKGALLTAIAAVGVKSNLKELVSVGYAPFILLVSETAFIAIVASSGFWLAGL